MNDSNLNTYTSTNVINWYTHLTEITAAEKHLFELHKEFLSKANVLDIGIGGGRTTAYLIDKCAGYIGVDYSQGFVEIVKQKYPKANIQLADARDLIPFEDKKFDVINFSFNGIDYVGLEDRKKIFSEINRVLKPNGLFFFSTHNKDHFTFDQQPWTDKNNSFFTNLKTFIKLLPFLPKHALQKKKEIRFNDYSIINDSAHNYSLMTFYTSPQFLKKQLKDHHFADVKLFSKDAKEVDEKKLDDWIFVSCKKSLA